MRRDADLTSILEWDRSISSPTEYYLDCVSVFYGPDFPESLREHRRYFTSNSRGFGEDAFHVMWWMVFTQLRPSRFLELGVYRGQTLSLASLLHRQFRINGSVVGISPFTSSGDGVSSYRSDVDYYFDTLENFRRFELPKPDLVRTFSTTRQAFERVRAQEWDIVYIDGNHDYGVAKSDWEMCRVCVRPGGLIVLDDSALGTTYKPPAFATAGHPGPSQLASEIDPSKFQEVLRVGHNRVFCKL
jgi:hypothetical protein